MKKNSFIIIVLLLSAVLMLTGCNTISFLSRVTRGSGNMATELRVVENFEYINFNGSGKLIITQGTGEKLLIEAEDNILPKLVSTVKNGVLTLGFETNLKSDQVIPTKEIVFTLNVIDLSGLTVNGAVSLELNSLVMQDFELNINGAGDFNLSDIQATNLTVTIDGGADVIVSGTSQNQNVTINGASKYDAGELQTTITEITLNGVGDSIVWVADDLTIQINGAGGVQYYGDPHVTQNISGIGNVKSMGEK